MSYIALGSRIWKLKGPLSKAVGAKGLAKLKNMSALEALVYGELAFSGAEYFLFDDNVSESDRVNAVANMEKIYNQLDDEDLIDVYETFAGIRNIGNDESEQMAWYHEQIMQGIYEESDLEYDEDVKLPKDASLGQKSMKALLRYAQLATQAGIEPVAAVLVPILENIKDDEGIVAGASKALKEVAASVTLAAKVRARRPKGEDKSDVIFDIDSADKLNRQFRERMSNSGLTWSQTLYNYIHMSNLDSSDLLSECIAYLVLSKHMSGTAAKEAVNDFLDSNEVKHS